MILQLKCKPQVYYFLKKNYGEVMNLSEKDTVCTLIFNHLLKNRANKHEEEKLKNYTCFYQIKISNYMYDKYHLKTFTCYSVRSINKYIDLLFELAFLLYVLKALHVDGKNLKTSIEDFMLLYDIDEDVYSFDALKKEYSRFKNGEKKNIEKLIKKIPAHLS